MSTKKFPCTSCGANIEFAPGSNQLECPYCGAKNEIAKSNAEILKLDFEEYVGKLAGTTETVETNVIKCTSCGAQSNLPPNVTAGQCPFCATPLIAGDAHAQRLIKPQALLPFHITRQQARSKFRDWINGLWFAPNALKKAARQESGLKGIYIPYWSYDCGTRTSYVGERGEKHEESYTDSKGEFRSRTVTRWYPASGEISADFNDVLAVGSQSLPREYAEKLEPWDIENLTPYQDEYLSGFTAESYRINLGTGFEHAKETIQNSITALIKEDIGGYSQRINSMQVDYSKIMFRHVLLPIWLSSYRFKGKAFRFLINARTGEVQGERPWSTMKIAGAISLAIMVFIILVMIFNH